MRQFGIGSLSVLMIVAGLALTGCDKNKPPFAGRAEPMLRENYPRISVEGEELSKYLAFSPANVQSGPEQPLSVAVPVRLLADREANIQYRFEFFTKDGRPMRNAMEWRYLRLPPRTETSLEGAALDTNAVEWRLIIRSSRSKL